MTSPAEMRLLVRMIQYESKIPEQSLREILLQSENSEDLFEKMIADGLVDSEWVSQVRTSLRKRLRQLHGDACELVHEDRSFGQLVLKEGWAKVGDLETAILEQQRLRRVNLRFRIGEIMLQLGQLSEAQVRNVLEMQGYRAMACSCCEVLINVSQSHEENNFQLNEEGQFDNGVFGKDEEIPCCPQCSGELHDAIFLDTVQTDKQLC